MACPEPNQESGATVIVHAVAEDQNSDTQHTVTGSLRSSSVSHPHASENNDTNTNETSNSITNPQTSLNRHPLEQQTKREWDWEKFRWVVTPSHHELPLVNNPEEIKTTRHYSYRKQRWRLLNRTIGEWLMTVILCLAIFGMLYGYSKWKTFDAKQKRVFNTIATGLAVALGINLASSLRSYAKLLRWRLLAGRYRNLHQFELLLGAERQTNVIKLFWSEFFREDRRYRFLPSGTQILCILWLLINLAATLLVAILGLTYNLDQSQSYVLIQRGNTSIVNFAYLEEVSYEQGLSLANLWGFTGFTDFLPTQSLTEDANLPDDYETTGNGFSRYWEIDYNANDFTQSVQTDRYVDVQAHCQAYDVIEGEEGQLPYVVYDDNGRHVNVTIYKDNMPGSGGILFISDRKSRCGSRCVNVDVFQAMSSAGDTETAVTKGQYYTCTNHMSQVQNIPLWNPGPYTMSDLQAQTLAGAIGWSGNPVAGGDTREFRAWHEDSELVQFFYITSATAGQIANLVSGYAAAAVAVADNLDSPARQYVVGDEPVKADYLHVHWWYAGTVLILIPTLQFLSMVAVIAWANRAIIKDDSYLAAAKLYAPLLQRLGDHGCILRGDQIVRKLGDPRVTYGFVHVSPDLMHVDVFEQSSGVKLARTFDEGDYDGLGSDASPEVELKRPRKLKVD